MKPRHKTSGFMVLVQKALLLLVLLPTLALAEAKQWETLEIPPGAEESCEKLLGPKHDNGFTRDWSKTEAYQKLRYYEGGLPPQGRMLQVPKPIVKVLFPSMTLPYAVIGGIKNIEAYELRGFCPEVMKTAVDPTAHLVIVTSVELEDATVKNCIRQVMRSKVTGARSHPELLDSKVNEIFNERIHLFSVDDASALPLSQKFLQNETKKQELKKLVDSLKARLGVPDEAAFMQTFVTTPQEGWVAEFLGISIWGNPLMNASVEVKSNYHKLAGAAGITKADAIPDIFGEKELVEAIYTMIGKNMQRLYSLYAPPDSSQYSLPLLREIYDGLPESDRKELVTRLMLKWDQGTSGQGNAPKTLSDEEIQAFLSGDKALALSVIQSRLTENLKTADAKNIPPRRFVDQLVSNGGVVEQFVPFVQTFLNADGEELPVSPSGQADIKDRGILMRGCHEQKFLPGVPGGVFEGAIYGWSRLGEEICRQVYQKTLKIGQILKQMGYRGRYAVDFVVARDPETKELQVIVIEINARSGGTHTVDAMVAVTFAVQFEESLALERGLEPYHWYAMVRQPDGAERFVKLYNEGTDNFYHKGLKRFCSDQELLDFLYHRDPRYWRASQQDVPMINSVNKRGILPHMIQARKGTGQEKGKMGFVAVGHDSVDDARTLFKEFSTSLSQALDRFEQAHKQRQCSQ